jgi:hypothetical protein
MLDMCIDIGCAVRLKCVKNYLNCGIKISILNN